MKKVPWPIPVLAVCVITFGVARLCVSWLALAMTQRESPWIWDINHWLWQGRNWIAMVLGVFSLVAAWRKYGKDSVGWATAIVLIFIAALAVSIHISTWT